MLVHCQVLDGLISVHTSFGLLSSHPETTTDSLPCHLFLCVWCFQALQLLKQAGIAPDIVTMNSLIKAAGAAGEMEQVCHLASTQPAHEALTSQADHTRAAQQTHFWNTYDGCCPLLYPLPP